MQTANEVVTSCFEQANWKEDPVDLTSTDGLQRAIRANTLAIHALANLMDGLDPEGQPIKAQKKN